MKYTKEKDLQRDIANIIASGFYNDEYCFLRREVPVGECIPDLVYIKLSGFPEIERWPQNWSSKHSYLVWLLRSWKSLSITEIADLFFENPARIRPIVTDLLKARIIVDGHRNYQLANNFASIKAEIYAYEAKLKKWKDALNQALRYAKFADKVIVVMDPDGLPRTTSAISIFSKNNIGLCTINAAGFNWVVEPQNNQNLGYEKEYLVNSVLSPKRQIFWSRLNNKKALCQA